MYVHSMNAPSVPLLQPIVKGSLVPEMYSIWLLHIDVNKFVTNGNTKVAPVTGLNGIVGRYAMLRRHRCNI